MQFKTRYTSELTFKHYSFLAQCETANQNCPIGGKLEWFERWSEKEDEFTLQTSRRFLGRFIRCSCVDKHNCFQMSYTTDGRYRITSSVNDVVEAPYKVVIKRRRAA